MICERVENSPLIGVGRGEPVPCPYVDIVWEDIDYDGYVISEVFRWRTYG